jgi:hypothetical protein
LNVDILHFSSRDSIVVIATIDVDNSLVHYVYNKGKKLTAYKANNAIIIED